LAALGGIVLLALVCIQLDLPAARWAHEVRPKAWARWVSAAGVPLGGPLPYIAAIGLLVWAARRWDWPTGRRVAWLLPIVFAVTGLGSHGIKMIVGRPRPYMLTDPWPPSAASWTRRFDLRFQSFPSADVMVASGLVTVLMLLLEDRPARYLLLAIPLASSLGRMVIVVHYPTDCLGAMVLGSAAAWGLWHWQLRWLARRRHPSPPASQT
jgi:membrane-associated phospholipid phosphatase